MKGMKIIGIAGMAVLAVTAVLALQTAYAVDHIGYLVPADTVAVEAGGGEYPAVLMSPTKFEIDRIELLPAAE